MRQAKMFSVVVGDLKKSLVLPPERYNLFPTLQEVKDWNAKDFAFDFEWDRDGNITVCGLTDRFYSAIVVPFAGAYIPELKRIFESATSLIGHNIINADMAHLDRLGWDVSKAVIEDTMLKQHLVQPDMKHDLGFVASVFTNKVFWKGKWGEIEDEDGNLVPSHIQWKTWDSPDLGIPKDSGGYLGCRSGDEAYRLYNARDTDAEFQINIPLSQALRRFDIEAVYRHVSVPAAFICRDIGERGFKLDTSRLGEIREVLDKEIIEYEDLLPEGLKPYEQKVPCNCIAAPGTLRPKFKTCKGNSRNPHSPKRFEFTSLGQEYTCECGKKLTSGKMVEAKITKGTRIERIVPYNSTTQVQAYSQGQGLRTIKDTKSGNITTGKRARKLWGSKDHPEFSILDKLKEKITLRNNFAKDSLLGQDRMYFNLKVHGTSEGRLASSGRREGIDLNIQNQPEEFRIIYVPDNPGWGILNLDISGAENYLTTWLAEDWDRWERLKTPGYDEHCDLASKIFGRPISKSKDDKLWRDVGKKINHGRNYGMGVKKQREFLVEEGFNYSEADIKEFVEIWKGLNAGTAKWQQRTIETAQKQGWLCNPFGRKRWFQSRDISGQSLAFLPASTLADMVLRMMFCHFPTDPRIWPSVDHWKMGVFHEMARDWRMAAQVHDSIVLMGPHDGHMEQARKSASILCQPWPELNGFHFECDIKYSTKSWGEVSKLKLEG